MEKKSNYQGVKLPGHPVRTGQARGPFDPALRGTHGPEYVEWVPQARSGERDASKGSFVNMVPLDPAYKAGSRGTFRSKIRLF